MSMQVSGNFPRNPQAIAGSQVGTGGHHSNDSVVWNSRAAHKAPASLDGFQQAHFLKVLDGLTDSSAAGLVLDGQIRFGWNACVWPPSSLPDIVEKIVLKPFLQPPFRRKQGSGRQGGSLERHSSMNLLSERDELHNKIN